MTDTNSSLTRRDLLAAGAGVAATTVLPSAAAQPVPNMPGSARELWQWVRTQPMLDAQLAYVDVAGGGPTVRGGMAAQ